MRHEFDTRFRYADNSLYILVPEMTANYLVKKLGVQDPPHLHGEPVRVELEV
jgi:hypothetical protein